MDIHPPNLSSRNTPNEALKSARQFAKFTSDPIDINRHFGKYEISLNLIYRNVSFNYRGRVTARREDVACKL